MPAYNYYQPNLASFNSPYYYPQGYQPVVPQQQAVVPQQQPVVPQQQVNQASVQTPIQSGGFVSVRSEAEARTYPVAPGTSVTFKHETEPYCYTKTLGLSQFEPPKFEKYRLVKEEDAEYQMRQETKEDAPEPYATKEELGKLSDSIKGVDELLNAVKEEIDGIKSDVDGMKSDMYGMAGRKKTAKKTVVADDE